MHWIREQNILVHYIYENALEIIAENDLKSTSTETNQENACDLF